MSENYGYVRLSREDLSAPGKTEEKLKDRAQICLNLAREHGIPLREENIILEQESATRLSTRPGALQLLDLAKRREVGHVFTPYQDRLLRGDKRDEQDVEDAFVDGEVTVISTEGILPFNQQFRYKHGLLYDVKNAVARQYVTDLVEKRKQADFIRLKQGKRSRAFVPYGFGVVSKRDVLEGRFPAEQLGEVYENPDEYPILREILDRLRLGEKAPAICRDLESRGIPPPSAARPGRKGRRWYASSIYGIIRNPFYAGYLSQRSVVLRNHKKVRLKPEEYILSDVEGGWSKLMTMDDYHANQARIQGHKQRAAPRTGLLTGILHCPNGEPMVVRTGQSYGCDCRQVGRGHTGALVSGTRVLEWVKEIINNLVEAMPADALPTPKGRKPNRNQAITELGRAHRQLAEKEQQAQEIILRESYFVDLMGRDTYESTAKKTGQEVDALRRQVAELQEIAATPDSSESLTLLQRVKRAGGMPVFWETSTYQEQRGIIERVIRRVEIVAPEARFVREARVDLWEWAAEYSPEIPPFPKLKSGHPDNLFRWLNERR